MKKVITYGTFDVIHEGHINILRRAKALGDYLIVGISSDTFNSIKGKKSFQSFKERKKILENIKYVDKVISEDDWKQKAEDIKKYSIDIFTMGSDWVGKFDDLRTICKVVYIPRTKGISSTQIRENIFQMFLDKVELHIQKSSDLFQNISMKLSSVFFIPFFYIFSYIIKKQKGLYIFGSMNAQNMSGNSKAMYKYYQKNKQIQTYYMTRNKKNIQKNTLYIISWKSIFSILKAEYIFTDSSASSVSPSLALLGNFKIVRLWHGDAIKKINFDSKKYISSIGKVGQFLLKNEYKNNILIPVGSQESKKNMDSAFLGDTAKITGLPRNDIFFSENKRKIKEKIELYFSISTYKKIFLYTPTWRDTQSTLNPFSKKILSQINEYCKSNNYIFLISGHIQTEKISFQEMSHIKNFKNDNIETQELLQIADVLITDYSSIYIDFLLSNKPILFYAYDKEKYISKDRELYFNYNSVIIEETLTQNENDFFDTLKNIESISRKKDYINQYTTIKNLFHTHQNGGYCKRLDSYITNIKRKCY